MRDERNNPVTGGAAAAEGESQLNQRIIRVATASVLLLVLCSELHTATRGQDVGVYRVRQGRRVGGVTLPTPPFNPNAGILDSGKGRGHNSPKAAPRRSPGRGRHASKRNPLPGTPRRRRVRRGRFGTG